MKTTPKIQHHTSPVAIHSNNGLTGSILYSGLSGQDVLSARNFLLYYRQQGPIFTFSGPPDTDTLNLLTMTGSHSGLNLDVDIKLGTYYIINRVPPTNCDIDRKYLLSFTEWLSTETDNDKTIKWYKDYTSVSYSVTLMISRMNDALPCCQSYLPLDRAWWTTGAVDTSYLVYLAPRRVGPLDLSMSYKPDANGGFVCGKISTTGIQMAALSIIAMPENIYLQDERAEMNAYNIASGEIIQGYDPDAKVHSLGKIIHDMGNDLAGYDADTIEAITRPVYFQWGHPVGVWLSNTTGHDNVFGSFTFRIWDRNIRRNGSGYTYATPAFVIKGTQGAEIKYESVKTGSSYTKVLGAGVTSAKLYYAGDESFKVFDRSDGTGYDDIIITAKAATANDEIIIYTVGLFGVVGC